MHGAARRRHRARPRERRPGRAHVALARRLRRARREGRAAAEAGGRADRAAVLRVQRAPRHGAGAARPEGGRRARRVPAARGARRRRDRELPARRRRPARHRLRRGARGEPARSSTARRAATARPARARSGPATTSTTSRSAATSTARAATPTAGPRCRARRSATRAGGGMQAVIAILAALVRRAATGEGAYLDVSVADGVRRAHVAATSTSTSRPARCPGRGHNILTGRYACYDVYRCADDRWVAVGAIEPHFCANLCRALGCEQWIAHQTDDAVQDAIRADFRAAFATRDARRVGRRRSARPTRACRAGRDRCPSWSTTPHFAARGVFVAGDRAPGTATSTRSAGCSRAWTATQPGRSCRDATRHRHRRAAARGRAIDAARSRRSREEGVVA